MRVLIVEDEPLAAERLKLLLVKYEVSATVEAVVDSISMARNWLAANECPDLIFMDIELADGRSFAILDDVCKDCPVVFTTAYDQYALDAFRHLCLDYLVKPISSAAMQRALDRYAMLASSRQAEKVSEKEIKPETPTGQVKNRFLVRHGSRMSFVAYDDIAYFFADGKNVFLVTRSGSRYPIDMTLEKLEKMVDPSMFFRFNRKVIGSATAIRDIRTYINSRLRILLHAGNQTDEAIVSRDRVKAFREWANAV